MSLRLAQLKSLQKPGGLRCSGSRNTGNSRMAFNLESGRNSLLAIAGLALILGISGCSSTPHFQSAWQAKTQAPEPIRLREGDVIRIGFPGAPNLNALQQIRRDGRITLPLGVGEVVAAGMTPSELEKHLIDLFATQLVSKEVTVAIESSSFPVFITGAVHRPGKILSDHPITALEAIMEAGGFDYARANLKSVVVIRNTEGRLQRLTVNLKRVLQGQDTTVFNLKPGDIIFVPEKFSWF
jgi:polysaccharide biosynthesis/export protein